MRHLPHDRPAPSTFPGRPVPTIEGQLTFEDDQEATKEAPMGYDMSIRNYSGPGTVESENGNTDGDYFRLNIWGMSTMRPIMAAADVLDTMTPDPSWPSYPGDEHF